MKRVCQKRTTGKGVFEHAGLSKVKKSKKTLPLSRNRHVKLYALVRKSFPFDVCMFENPLPVMDFEHTYKHIVTIYALTKIKS